jgi:group I intron endonuclease
MFIGYVYITKNNINNRAYVGKKYSTTFDNTYYGSGILLNEAIKKYGKNNFTIEILDWAKTEDELNMMEIYFIENYKNKTKLYNIAKGGSGGDTRSNHPNKNNISNKQKKSIKMWHSSLSTEEKKQHSIKISNAKKGKPRTNNNYVYTKQACKNISDGLKNSAYYSSEKWKETHKKITESKKGKPNNACRKPIIIDEVRYESMKTASEKLNKSRQTIHNWIKNGKAQYN